MSNATFVINTFGKLEPYSQTLSKARARIFYIGLNRNATYITEEFAQKLLSTIPYAPVKGIYKDSDYSDHGGDRNEGRIYGIVPENANITWENHIDDDGVIRKYACVDVLLFTALYPEAEEIVNKGESMEIYAQSIKGMRKIMNGQSVYVYTEGHFLGLQILGEKIEPCFEGAQFFSLYNNLKKLIDTLEGGKDMNLNFKLSDSKKHDLLFGLINPNFTEEKNYQVDYSISDIYEDYALCYNYEKQEFCRFYYKKDDEKDTCSLIGEPEKCFIVDVTETEYAALNLLRDANGGNFEKVDEVFSAANEKIENLTAQLEEKNSEFNTKIVELEAINATLKQKEVEFTEKDATIASLQETLDAITNEKDATIESLTGELSTLREYKDGVETATKKEIVSKYNTVLDSETISNIIENLNTYTIIDLKKELAYLATENNPNLFTQKSEIDPDYIPTNNIENYSGATKILMKHKKNK